jgi:hypothetical protein
MRKLNFSAKTADEKYTVKKVIDFPVPSRDVTTKLSLAGNNLVIPGQREFGS